MSCNIHIINNGRYHVFQHLDNLSLYYLHLFSHPHGNFNDYLKCDAIDNVTILFTICYLQIDTFILTYYLVLYDVY